MFELFNFCNMFSLKCLCPNPIYYVISIAGKGGEGGGAGVVEIEWGILVLFARCVGQKIIP